jgi:hypothetical protein
MPRLDPLRWLMCAAVFLPGCEDVLDGTVAPTIQTIRPAVAQPGGAVTLIGTHFGQQGPFDAAYVGGIEADVIEWRDLAVRLRVPDDERRGVLPVVLRTDGRVSRPMSIEIVDPPGADMQADGGMVDMGVDALP